jgi:hypothetical protein
LKQRFYGHLLTELKAGALMFTVEYTLQVAFKSGQTSFARGEQIPFAPFIGLDILDNVVGEFKIQHVAWPGNVPMFVCQATRHFRNETISQLTKRLRKGGWREEKESREIFDSRIICLGSGGASHPGGKWSRAEWGRSWLYHHWNSRLIRFKCRSDAITNLSKHSTWCV